MERRRICGAMLALVLAWAAAPRDAVAQGVGAATGGTGAGLPANPYANPYLNPFLNPYIGQYATTPGDAALLFYAAQQANGGIGTLNLTFTEDFSSFKGQYNDYNYHPDKWAEWNGKIKP